MCGSICAVVGHRPGTGDHGRLVIFRTEILPPSLHSSERSPTPTGAGIRRAGADGGRRDAFPSRSLYSVVSEPPQTSSAGPDCGDLGSLAVGRHPRTPLRTGLGGSAAMPPAPALATRRRCAHADPGPGSSLQGGRQEGFCSNNNFLKEHVLKV